MARRSGMMTALQAALAGFSGGIEGRMQQRAADEEKSRLTAALTRQKEQDAFAKASFLQNAGYRIAPEAYDTEDPEARRGLMPLSSPEPMTKPELRAAGALDSAIKRGMGVDTTQPSIGRPTFGQAPLALDKGATRMTDVFERAKGMRPAQEQAAASVDLPGVGQMRFLAPESAAQVAARTIADYEAKKKADAAIAAQAKADERKAKDQEARDLADVYVTAFTSKDGKPMPMTQALAAAKSGKTPLDLGFAQKPMTEEEQQRLAIMKGNLDVSRSQLSVSQERLAFDKTKDGSTTKPTERFSGDYTQTLNKIADFLPTTDPKTGALIAPKRPLSAEKSLLVQEGSPERGFLGRASLVGASTLGYDTSEEQLYNTLAKEVATAYAMKEQQGRNVSNADLLNRQSQITMQPNEVGNLEIQKVKGDRLKQWAQALQSGTPIPQVKAGETIVPPTLGETRESLRDAGFSEAEINAYFAQKGGGK